MTDARSGVAADYQHGLARVPGPVQGGPLLFQLVNDGWSGIQPSRLAGGLRWWQDCFQHAVQRPSIPPWRPDMNEAGNASE